MATRNQGDGNPPAGWPSNPQGSRPAGRSDAELLSQLGRGQAYAPGTSQPPHDGTSPIASDPKPAVMRTPILGAMGAAGNAEPPLGKRHSGPLSSGARTP
jgi:hypothetical protein